MHESIEGMNSCIYLYSLCKPFKVFQLRQGEGILCFCANAFHIH